MPQTLEPSRQSDDLLGFLISLRQKYAGDPEATTMVEGLDRILGSARPDPNPFKGYLENFAKLPEPPPPPVKQLEESAGAEPTGAFGSVMRGISAVGAPAAQFAEGMTGTDLGLTEVFQRWAQENPRDVQAGFGTDLLEGVGSAIGYGVAAAAVAGLIKTGGLLIGGIATKTAFIAGSTAAGAVIHGGSITRERAHQRIKDGFLAEGMQEQQAEQAAWVALDEAGKAHQKMMSELTPRDVGVGSVAKTVGGVLTNTALDVIPIGGHLHRVLPKQLRKAMPEMGTGARTLLSLAGSGVEEGVTEGLQEVVQAKVAEKDVDWEETMTAMAVGGVLGTAYGGAAEALTLVEDANNTKIRMALKQQLDMDSKEIDKLMEGMDSKRRKVLLGKIRRGEKFSEQDVEPPIPPAPDLELTAEAEERARESAVEAVQFVDELAKRKGEEGLEPELALEEREAEREAGPPDVPPEVDADQTPPPEQPPPEPPSDDDRAKGDEDTAYMLGPVTEQVSPGDEIERTRLSEAMTEFEQASRQVREGSDRSASYMVAMRAAKRAARIKARIMERRQARGLPGKPDDGFIQLHKNEPEGAVDEAFDTEGLVDALPSAENIDVVESADGGWTIVNNSTRIEPDGTTPSMLRRMWGSIVRGVDRFTRLPVNDPRAKVGPDVTGTLDPEEQAQWDSEIERWKSHNPKRTAPRPEEWAEIIDEFERWRERRWKSGLKRPTEDDARRLWQAVFGEPPPVGEEAEPMWDPESEEDTYADEDRELAGEMRKDPKEWHIRAEDSDRVARGIQEEWSIDGDRIITIERVNEPRGSVKYRALIRDRQGFGWLAVDENGQSATLSMEDLDGIPDKVATRLAGNEHIANIRKAGEGAPAEAEYTVEGVNGAEVHVDGEGRVRPLDGPDYMVNRISDAWENSRPDAPDTVKPKPTKVPEWQDSEGATNNGYVNPSEETMKDVFGDIVTPEYLVTLWEQHGIHWGQITEIQRHRNAAPNERIVVKYTVRKPKHEHKTIKTAQDGSTSDRLMMPAPSEKGISTLFLADVASRQHLEREIKKIAPQATIRFVNALYGRGPALAKQQKETGREVTQEAEVGGKVDRARAIVYIALNGKFDSRKAAHHEAYHLARMALTDLERAVMEREFDNEEAEAEAFAESFDSEPGLFDGQPGSVANLLHKLRLFFERIGNALRGNGYQAVEDVFVALKDGTVGARMELGRRLADETERYAFWLPDDFDEQPEDIQKVLLQRHEHDEKLAADRKKRAIEGAAKKRGMTTEEWVKAYQARSQSFERKTRPPDWKGKWREEFMGRPVGKRWHLRRVTKRAEDAIKKRRHERGFGAEMGTPMAMSDVKDLAEHLAMTPSYISRMGETIMDGHIAAIVTAYQRLAVLQAIRVGRISQSFGNLIRSLTREQRKAFVETRGFRERLETLKYEEEIYADVEAKSSMMNSQVGLALRAIKARYNPGPPGRAKAYRLMLKQIREGKVESIAGPGGKKWPFKRMVSLLGADPKKSDWKDAISKTLALAIESETEAVAHGAKTDLGRFMEYLDWLQRIAHMASEGGYDRMKQQKMDGLSKKERAKLYTSWFFFNNLLWSPTTFLWRNPFGIAMQAYLFMPLKTVGTAVIKGLGRKLFGRDAWDGESGTLQGNRSWAAIGHKNWHKVLFGTVKDLKEAGKQGWHTLMTGKDLDLKGESDSWFYQDISQWSNGWSAQPGKGWFYPVRMLAAVDKAGRTLVERRKLRALAYEMLHDERQSKALESELEDKPEERDIHEKAEDYVEAPDIFLRTLVIQQAKEVTYTQPLKGMAKRLHEMRDEMPAGSGVALLPFMKIATNQLIMGARYIPLLSLAYTRKKKMTDRWDKPGREFATLSDIKSGEGGMRETFIYEQLVAFGIPLLTYYLVREGLMTGTGEEDRDRYGLWRDAGWQPGSVAIGGRWYFLSSILEHFSHPFLISASMWETLGVGSVSRPRAFNEEAKPWLERTASGFIRIMASSIESLVEKSYLQGPGRLFNDLTSDEDEADALMKYGINILAPKWNDWRVRRVEPYVRSRKDMFDEVKYRLIQSLRDDLEFRTDVFGRPLEMEEHWTGLKASYRNPMPYRGPSGLPEGGGAAMKLGPHGDGLYYYTSGDFDEELYERRKGPMLAELLRLRLTFPRAPDTMDDGTALTGPERSRYNQLLGFHRYIKLEPLFMSKGYWEVDADIIRTKMIQGQLRDMPDDKAFAILEAANGNERLLDNYIRWEANLKPSARSTPAPALERRFTDRVD